MLRMERNYFTGLPDELKYIIIGSIKLKKDLDNFLKTYDSSFVSSLNWEEVGGQLYPGKSIKNMNDFYLNSLQLELYSNVLFKDPAIIKIKHKLVNNNFGQVKLLACSDNINVIVNTDDEIYIFGIGMKDLHIKDENIPTKVDGYYGKIKQISCGDYHIAFINENGELYRFGLNHYFQLGADNEVSMIVPTKMVEACGKVVQVSCGSVHTIFLTEDGRLYAAGLTEGGVSTQFEVLDPKIGETKIKSLVNSSNTIAILTNAGYIKVLSYAVNQSDFYQYQSRSDCIYANMNRSNTCFIRNNNIICVIGNISSSSDLSINKLEMYINNSKKVTSGYEELYVLTEDNILHIIKHPGGEIIKDVIDIVSCDMHSMYLKYA